MSKYLGLAKNGRGKLGNVVLQRNNVQRFRQREIANPRTQAQIIQRVILATAAGMTAGLKGIVNHSFENIPYGAKSLNHFRKMCLKALRLKAAEDMQKPIGQQNGCFLPKGFNVPLPNSGINISEGSIPYDSEYNPMYFGNPENIDFNLKMYSDHEADVTGWSWSEFWWYFLGMRPGMQLTWVYFGLTFDSRGESPLYSAAPWEDAGGGWINLNRQLWKPYVKLERIVLKDELSRKLMNTTTIGDPADFYQTLYDSIDWDKSTKNGVWDLALTYEESGFFEVNIADDKVTIFSIGPSATIAEPDQNDIICAVASIRSEYERGKWRRTTSPIVLTPYQLKNAAIVSAPFEGLNISDAIASWRQPDKLGESTRYLNEGV